MTDVIDYHTRYVKYSLQFHYDKILYLCRHTEYKVCACTYISLGPIKTQLKEVETMYYHVTPSIKPPI